VKLSPKKFNRFVARIGQNVSWKRAYDCPCKDPNSGAASYDCLICDGVGHVWDDALPCNLALSGQKIQRQWADFGAWENGDVVVTIGSDSPVYKAGEFDRITLEDSSAPFSITKIHDGSERLPFKIVVIDRIFWLDDESNIINGEIPTVDVDGSLTWIVSPPSGIQYSITGRRRPEYYMYQEFPQDRAHFQGAALPRRVVLRSFELMSKSL